MKCNVKECYWNMWMPIEGWSDDSNLQCISESLGEHYDEDKSFRMNPNSRECEGYLSYREFCGVEKGEKHG